MRPRFMQDAGKHYSMGLIAVAISAALFSLPAIWPSQHSDSGATFPIFVFNYTAVVFYGVSLFYRKKWKNMPVFLVLALISAYSLNRSMDVFEHSAPWLTGVLVVHALSLLLLPVFDALPRWLRHTVSVLLGAALLLFIYLSIYLAQLYLLSIPAAILLGVSLHSFVPLFISSYLIWKMVDIGRGDSSHVKAMLAGMLISVSIVVGFTMQWNKINTVVSRAYQRSLIADKADLPGWVRVAQALPEGSMTEKYLKGELVYTTYQDGWPYFGWGLPQKNFDEPRKHDPLVMLAGFFTATPDIPVDDRIKMLEAIYVSGHQSQDRYWRGEDLVTAKVISNVRIWPAQRLAYTEKTITVKNTVNSNRWRNQEEAIYTFHLPEGSIVTSLSLWIAGREQPGILTTRQKADSAYKQIVGVESRDPSVVHWQEGNTVTVRVFPVLSGESRIFKVGFTAPLTYTGGMLRYDNTWFEGPDYSSATELRQVHWAGVDKDPQMHGFTKNAAHRYERDCSYEEDWHIDFNDPGFVPEAFGFGNSIYSIAPYEHKRSPAVFNTVYLDVNSSWTAAEAEQVTELLKGRKVMVYDGAMQELVPGSDDLNRLLRQRFTLFPFHLVASPATSLVITKSTRYSPSLKALKGFSFADDLARGVRVQEQPVRLFNLSKELSLYHRTLKEHRVFYYEQGDFTLLKKLVETGTFASGSENDSMVAIDNAMIALHKTSVTPVIKGGGQDHIMRLFAYNHIMLSLKGNLFPDSYSDSALVAEAEQAYVVTPVSSLVVLESQKDYDRFGIKKGMNTLDNATLKGNGAVPEPHEWALIILALAALAWAYRSKRLDGVNR